MLLNISLGFQNLFLTLLLKLDHWMTEQFGLGGFKGLLTWTGTFPLSQTVPSPVQTCPGTRDPSKTRNSQLGRSHLHVLRNKCLGLKLTASKGSSSSTSAPHSCSTESLSATTATAKSCKTSCKPLPVIPVNQSLGKGIIPLRALTQN